MAGNVRIRDAVLDDWPAIWAFMRTIVAAGETFSWDQDLSEAAARARWLHGPPGGALAAVDDCGAVIGTATYGANHEGPASHVATASFMVDPAHFGEGAGRALGQRVLDLTREQGYRGIQFNAVVETNTRAVELWKSLGFGVLATIPEGFNHPEHGYVGLLVMFQRLAP